jgi:transcription elongation factor GreA
MSPSALEAARTQLVRQLVFFDEEKTVFLDRHFPAGTRERAKVDQLLGHYCAALEQLIPRLAVEDLQSTALIGSRVRLQYLDDGSEETYTIVFPALAEPDRLTVSFLSPIGIQLLLAVPGKIYTLDTPACSLDVRIQGIEFAQLGEVC